MEDLKNQLITIDRVKIQRPKDSTYIRVQVLIVVYSIKEASRVYKEGIIQKYQQLFYKPFLEEARPIQCFKC